MGSGPRLVRNLTVRRIDDGALARRDARAPLRMILHVEDGLIEPAGRITLQVRLAVRATRNRPPLYQRSLIVRAEFCAGRSAYSSPRRLPLRGCGKRDQRQNRRHSERRTYPPWFHLVLAGGRLQFG